MNTTLTLNLVKRGIDAVNKRVGTTRETWRNIGPPVTTKEGIYRVVNISDMDYMQLTGQGEDITPSGREKLTDTEYRPKKFSKLFDWTIEAAIFDVYGEAVKVTKTIMRLDKKTQNREMCGLFNDGFTVNGYDGVPLFSAAHTDVTAGTAVQSNLHTVALGTSSLQTALVSLYSQLDADGLPLDLEGSVTLHVPINLWPLSYELTENTREKPGTTDRDPNWSALYVKPDVQRHMTSTTGFVLKMSDPEEHGFRMLQFGGGGLIWREGQNVSNGTDAIAANRLFLPMYSQWRGSVGKS
jgi:hypothetical protein